MTNLKYLTLPGEIQEIGFKAFALPASENTIYLGGPDSDYGRWVAGDVVERIINLDINHRWTALQDQFEVTAARAFENNALNLNFPVIMNGDQLRNALAYQNYFEWSLDQTSYRMFLYSNISDSSTNCQPMRQAYQALNCCES